MSDHELGKRQCKHCGWHGWRHEVLTAQNPFDSDTTIDGCPSCKSVDCLDIVCDEPGCWSEASCGTSTKSGYRLTCGMHIPKEAKT